MAEDGNQTRKTGTVDHAMAVAALGVGVQVRGSRLPAVRNVRFDVMASLSCDKFEASQSRGRRRGSPAGLPALQRLVGWHAGSTTTLVDDGKSQARFSKAASGQSCCLL